MSANVDVLNPDKPKSILMVAANAAVSGQTGWPIGFWAAELTHPYHEFTERGYRVEIVSPDGGDLQIDGYSDPRHESGYSAHDLISLGFLSSPAHGAMLRGTKALNQVRASDYDGLFLAGGQSPMYTFVNNEPLHRFVAQFYEAGKAVAIVCHATCVLLKTRLANGELLVKGKTWTGFADSEEEFADRAVGQRIQPFWIETEAKKLKDTNFITGGPMKSFAIRDGRLITGQQQYSGAAAARLLIEALGV